MPVYCFIRADTKERVEHSLTFSGFDQSKNGDGTHTIEIDGEPVLVLHDLKRQCSGFRNTPGNWPMECYAAGVSPTQIREAQEAAAKEGVHIDFNPKTGDAIFESRAHRRRYCEVRGLFDRDGGYSDAQYTGRIKEDDRY